MFKVYNLSLVFNQVFTANIHTINRR